MSLLTIKVFMDALGASSDVTELVDDRIWPIGVPGDDVEFLNTPLPYIVVGYSGPNNPAETKDDRWVGSNDKEQIHVLFVGKNLDELADIEEKGRAAIVSYFDSLDPSDDNYALRPSNVLDPQGDMAEMNPYKPDYYHQLTYQCETDSNAGYDE